MMQRAIEIIVAVSMATVAFIAAASPELDLVGMQGRAREAAVQVLEKDKDALVPTHQGTADEGLYSRLLRRNIFSEDGSYDAAKKAPDLGLGDMDKPKQSWSYKLMAITRSGGHRQAVFMENNQAPVTVSEGMELKDGSRVVYIGEVAVYASANDGTELKEYRIFDISKKADQAQGPAINMVPGQALNMPLSPEARQQLLQRQKEAAKQLRQAEAQQPQTKDPRVAAGQQQQQPQPQRQRLR